MSWSSPAGQNSVSDSTTKSVVCFCRTQPDLFAKHYACTFGEPENLQQRNWRTSLCKLSSFGVIYFVFIPYYIFSDYSMLFALENKAIFLIIGLKHNQRSWNKIVVMVKKFDFVLDSAKRKRTKMCTTGTLRQHDFLAFQSYDGYCFVALPCDRRTVRQQQSHCSYEVFRKEPPLGINADDLEKLLLYFVLSKGSQRTINFNFNIRFPSSSRQCGG